MRKLLCFALTGAFFQASAAAAFNSSDDGIQGYNFGNCQVEAQVREADKLAYVIMSSMHDLSDYMPGGSYYASGNSHNAFNPITEAAIAYCLSVGVDKVMDLQQNGADSTFENDNYIGFSFVLTQASGSLSAGAHEFKIGSRSVPAANEAPVAHAGSAQSITSGTQVTLSGSGTDSDGTIASYSWSRSGGTGDASNATLSSSVAQNPTFTDSSLSYGDSSVTHIFDLVVTDDDGAASDASQVTITINPPVNTAPTANAGKDETVNSGVKVSLDGTRSDPNDAGQTLTYLWDSPNVNLLDDPTAVQPSFTAPTLVAGQQDYHFTFTLTVNDGVSNSKSDSVVITVTAPQDTPPTANAGPDRAADSGAETGLDGSGSSPNDTGQTLTYRWTAPDGIALSDATAQMPTFTAPELIAGQSNEVLTFSLVVNDGVSASSADTVLVTVSPPSDVPASANAGPDATVASGTTVNLDGQGSSANNDGQSLTYRWTAPAGIALSDATAAQPSFTAPEIVAGQHNQQLTFELVVNDGVTDSVADTVVITVTAPQDVQPTANAGPDTAVASGATVSLDGSASNANNPGQALLYIWNAPEGVVLSDAEDVSPSFKAPDVKPGQSDQVLTFGLTVNDGVSSSAMDTVEITVKAPIDTDAPVISGTSDINVDTDKGEHTASVQMDATVVDNSGEVITPVFSIRSQQIANPHAFPVGATLVTVSAQDGSGNKAEPQSFTVTVTDVTGPKEPVISKTATSADGNAMVSGQAEPGSTVYVTFPDQSNVQDKVDPQSGVFVVQSSKPQRSGKIQVMAMDGAGNKSPIVVLDYVGDDQSPTATIADLNGPSNGKFTADIQLSEDSQDFTVEDLKLVNAVAMLSGSGSNYVVSLMPNDDGMFSVSVPANVFTDEAGNPNVASNEVTLVYDGTAPEVRITGAPDTLAATGRFNVTVTFSEEVSGFEASDIVATNATVTGLSGSGATYVAELTASGSGDITVSVPSDIAVDNFGNGNLASNEVSIADVTVEQTQERIAGYMQTRANQLVRNQPDLTSFMSGDARGKLNLSVTRGRGLFDFASDPDLPVWVQATGSWASDGDSKSSYMLGVIGSHKAINENLKLGGMLQLDHIEEETGDATVSGTGWMTGPYFAAKAPNHPLYFEGRLLYGESSNEISPFGTYEDSFSTRRLLAQMKVAGDLEYGETTLTPFFDASYATEDQMSYIDSLGNTVPKQGVKLGQVEVGMDFSKMVYISSGTLEIRGGASGIWSHSSGSGYATTVSPDYEGGRGRVELGMTHTREALDTISTSAFYDGIGASGYESFGVSLGYHRSF